MLRTRSRRGVGRIAQIVMWRRMMLSGVLGVVSLACGAQNSNTSPVAPTLTTTTGPTVTSVNVEVPRVRLSAGQSMQATATATYSDSSTADVTADPSTLWSSSNVEKATVLPGGGSGIGSGRIDGIRTGTVTISAQYQGIGGSAMVIIERAGSSENSDSAWTLSGRVTDRQNAGLAYAVVDVLDGPAKGRFTRTDTAGNFSIPGLYGNVNVEAQKYGYEKRRLGANRTNANLSFSLWQAFRLHVVAPTTQLRVGETTTVTGELRFRDGTVQNASPISWSCYCRGRATVTQDGSVHALSEGEVTIYGSYRLPDHERRKQGLVKVDITRE